MKGHFPKIVGFALLLVLGAFGYFEMATDDETQREAVTASAPTISPGAPAEASPSPLPSTPTDNVRRVIEEVEVKNYGRVIYRGSVDLSATIERIRAGESHPHRNDGAVFGNREGLLPRKSRGYYREYVHPTEGIEGPGPQRLVVGRDGDWWYTADHYASFTNLGRASP